MSSFLQEAKFFSPKELPNFLRCVYILFHKNIIIYVGKTFSLKTGLLDRLSYHKRRGVLFDLIAVIEQEELEECLFVEAHLIGFYTPALNVQYNPFHLNKMGRPQKLTDYQVRAAKHMRSNGMTLHQIGKKLGVSHSTVSRATSESHGHSYRR